MDIFSLCWMISCGLRYLLLAGAYLNHTDSGPCTYEIQTRYNTLLGNCYPARSCLLWSSDILSLKWVPHVQYYIASMRLLNALSLVLPRLAQDADNLQSCNLNTNEVIWEMQVVSVKWRQMQELKKPELCNGCSVTWVFITWMPSSYHWSNFLVMLYLDLRDLFGLRVVLGKKTSA